MKISIITVVYNRGRTIERAIQSVINQSYKNIEYIIIDGASRDNTMNVVNQYKNQLAVIVSEKDAGMYDALNKGIRLATGDIIGILHADDEFTDEKVIEQVASFMSTHHEVDCVYGDVGFVNESEPGKIVRYYSSAIFKKGLFKYGFMPAHPTFFCYRKFYNAFGGFRTDMDIAADFDLLVRFLYKNNLRYHYIPKMLVKMNLGGKSTSGIASTLKINSEIKKILSEHQIPSSYLRLYSRYFIKVQEYWKRKKII